MQPVIISDASCLILLEKIDELSLLNKLFGQVLITQTIADEFGLAVPEWISVQNPQDNKRQQILEASLDKGEASAIALALEHNDCLLIIDDLKGRKLARKLSLNVTGTLGIFVQAKMSGHIPSVKPLLNKFKQTNFRLRDGLIQSILKQVNE